MVDLVRDKVDISLSEEGVWQDIDNFGRVKIRKWNSPGYRKRVMELRDEKLEALNLRPDADLPEDVAQEIVIIAACEEVIIDWEGVTSDGKPVAYDPELAIEVFSDEAWREDFYSIVGAANDRSQYVKKLQEAKAKKS